MISRYALTDISYEEEQLNFKKLVGRKKIKLYDLRSIYSPEKLLKDKIDYFSIGR